MTLQPGGTPLLTPEDWYKVTDCGYGAPDDPYAEVLLERNIQGEQCAIGVYKVLSDLTRDADPVTYEMALSIMADEIEHKEDLQALREDTELTKSRS